ncbi:hypothetical protein ACMXYV_08305 [Neptuniibacter sp. SY11_33]|uniref:hypothetical protein n=1 Tax=Neptuniibacter sp. SY11_33 TaxID=3398215 RepID=UPI0039F5C9A8
MDFEKAFSTVISLWPSEIDISEVKFHESGGATIPELTKHHDQVFDQCCDLGKEVRAMDWSIFQYLHSSAQTSHANGLYVLNTKNIDLGHLRELYNENII